MVARPIVVMALCFGMACASNGQDAPTQPSPPAQQRTLAGQVTYLPRIALPAGAVVDVSLDDVSLADAPAQRLGSTSITTKGENVPIPFKVTYDNAGIRPERSYAVSARITIDGQLRWISSTRHAVLTAGHPSDDVTITVQQVPELREITDAASQPSDESSLLGRWQLERIEYGEDKTVTPSSPEKYRIEFFAGGTLVAQLDCNRGRGGYKISGSTLSVDPILSTLMACGGGSIAREFTQALQTATSFRRTGDTLTLSMPKNAGTMHLVSVH